MEVQLKSDLVFWAWPKISECWQSPTRRAPTRRPRPAPAAASGILSHSTAPPPPGGPPPSPSRPAQPRPSSVPHSFPPCLCSARPAQPVLLPACLDPRRRRCDPRLLNASKQPGTLAACPAPPPPPPPANPPGMPPAAPAQAKAAAAAAAEAKSAAAASARSITASWKRKRPLATAVAANTVSASYAEDLLVDQRGHGQAVEAVREGVPDLDVVAPLACAAGGPVSSMSCPARSWADECTSWSCTFVIEAIDSVARS